jgi:hypothetical protein
MRDRGVYFCTGMSEGSLLGHDLDFVIDLPPEVTFSSACRIRCRGHVVRCESTSWDETGIAVELDEYSIVREEQWRN